MAISKTFEYSGVFTDKRLDHRCELIATQIYDKGSAVIEQFSRSRKNVVSTCRFFNNDRVNITSLINKVCSRLKNMIKDKTILCIEDSTEFNYSKKQGRIKSNTLGSLTKADNIGFFVHPTLIVDTQTFIPLGVSDIRIWKRTIEAKDKHQHVYYKQPLEEKESYRWIDAMEKSKIVLEKAKHKIVVADREADIYPLFVRLKDEKTHLLLRMRSDRRTKDGLGIKEHLSKQAVKFYRSMNVKADLKEESHETVKKEEKPIEWTLLTTLPVQNISDAEKAVLYYSKRWVIEELFATLKTRGLSLEDSQLCDGNALMKLSILAMHVALKILQLTKGRHNESLSAEDIFSKNELALMKVLIPRYEGKTQKQKNLYKLHSLAWAAWIIGWMGGWKGYASESPPGNRTMKRGLDMLNNMLII